MFYHEARLLFYESVRRLCVRKPRVCSHCLYRQARTLTSAHLLRRAKCDLRIFPSRWHKLCLLWEWEGRYDSIFVFSNFVVAPRNLRFTCTVIMHYVFPLGKVGTRQNRKCQSMIVLNEWYCDIFTIYIHWYGSLLLSPNVSFHLTNMYIIRAVRWSPKLILLWERGKYE